MLRFFFSTAALYAYIVLLLLFDIINCAVVHRALYNAKRRNCRAYLPPLNIATAVLMMTNHDGVHDDADTTTLFARTKHERSRTGIKSQLNAIPF